MSSYPQLSAEHQAHLLSELGVDGLLLAVKLGARSIDATEAARLGFRFKGWASGGLLLPFGGDFAQLRCDHPPRGPNGDPVKYLNCAGTTQAPLTIGNGKPIAATEGFKDGIRLHLAIGQPVQAIAGVTSWKLLDPSVEQLIYDADAQSNPGVWVPLIRAGLQRRILRLGFFPAEIAGSKGGACEFFGASGDLADVCLWRARDLLCALPGYWTRTMRPDWQARSVRCLAMLATEAGMDRTAAEQLAAAGAKAVGMPTSQARRIARHVASDCRARPVTASPDAPSDVRLVAAAGAPLLDRVNAGGWAAALGRGIGSRLRHNLLSKMVELDGQPLRGEAEELLYVRAQQEGWTIKKADCYDGTRAVALRHAYHPVREYLDRVTTDPETVPADLDTIAVRYLNVEDALSAAMIRCLLIGAVARVHEPGCVAPGVVVLRGDQGIGKSGFWCALGGPFYVVSRHEDGAKDQILAMHGSWFYDLDELDKVTTAKQAAGMRSLITTTCDTFRVPYAQREESFPRQFVIVGAVNGDGFLTDPEGNRRYWVIDCPQAKDSGQFIDGPGVSSDRDAIWKAAVLAYRAGAKWTLTPDQQAASNVRNGKWEAIDEWEGALVSWAETSGEVAGFTIRKAIIGAGLRIEAAITKADEMRASSCLKRAGFVREENPSRRPDGRRVRIWAKALHGTTSLGNVVPTQTPCGTINPSTLAQPTQPVSEKTRSHETEFVSVGRKSLSDVERGDTGCADSSSSIPAQPISACTASPEKHAEVVLQEHPRKPMPIAVDGHPGWHLPGILPKGNSPMVRVQVTDPNGRSLVVERKRFTFLLGEGPPARQAG